MWMGLLHHQITTTPLIEDWKATTENLKEIGKKKEFFLEEIEQKEYPNSMILSNLKFLRKGLLNVKLNRQRRKKEELRTFLYQYVHTLHMCVTIETTILN